MTIQRISGSPVAMYAFDLNSSIFTEDGEFIYYGPYQLYMSGVSDVQVKWTLEHRSANPGSSRATCSSRTIPGGSRPPDGRDPAVPHLLGGQALLLDHQRAPPVRRGRHHPGSFCPNARATPSTRHPDPAAQDHRARRAPAATSRRCICAPRASPTSVALDLRAQIAGNVAASRRIVKLIERYGPDVVKGVMRKIIDTAEARLPPEDGQAAGRDLPRAQLRRGGPGGRSGDLPGAADHGEARRPARLRQRGDGAPDGRHQHDVLRLARLHPHRGERAALLGSDSTPSAAPCGTSSSGRPWAPSPVPRIPPR